MGANGHRPETVPPETDIPVALSYSDLLTRQIPPVRPLIAGIIDEGTGNIWSGPPNVGKTWLTLTAARAVASGDPWLGHFPTQQGTVLVVDEESHLAGLQGRLKMLEAGDPSGSSLPIHFAVGYGLRLDNASAAHLDRMMTEIRPSLVILDSLTRIHGADENSAGQMADVFGNAKALIRTHGAAFLFTDHVRKKSLINDPEEMLRGSTEKRAWPDNILFAGAGEPNTLTISHVKSRYGRRLDPFAVALRIDEAEGSALLVHGGAVTTSDATRMNDIILAIHEIKAQLGEDGADATTVAGWLECSADTVRRKVKKLVAMGIIRTRKVASGGKPKDVYDVVGGEG